MPRNLTDIDFDELEKDFDKLEKVLNERIENIQFSEEKEMSYEYRKSNKYIIILLKLQNIVVKAQGVTSAYCREEGSKYYYPYEKIELTRKNILEKFKQIKSKISQINDEFLFTYNQITGRNEDLAGAFRDLNQRFAAVLTPHLTPDSNDNLKKKEKFWPSLILSKDGSNKFKFNLLKKEYFINWLMYSCLLASSYYLGKATLFPGLNNFSSLQVTIFCLSAPMLVLLKTPIISVYDHFQRKKSKQIMEISTKEELYRLIENLKEYYNKVKSYNKDLLSLLSGINIGLEEISYRTKNLDDWDNYYLESMRKEIEEIDKYLGRYDIMMMGLSNSAKYKGEYYYSVSYKAYKNFKRLFKLANEIPSRLDNIQGIEKECKRVKVKLNEWRTPFVESLKNYFREDLEKVVADLEKFMGDEEKTLTRKIENILANAKSCQEFKVKFAQILVNELYETIFYVGENYLPADKKAIAPVGVKRRCGLLKIEYMLKQQSSTIASRSKQQSGNVIIEVMEPAETLPDAVYKELEFRLQKKEVCGTHSENVLNNLNECTDNYRASLV